MLAVSSRGHLSMVDYIVMAAMLVISLVIGFYFACTGGRQRSQREYLLAEGKMPFWPVCLSLFATFQSAIGLLGTPADVYEYGTMVVYGGLGVALANLITAIVIVPLFYPLRLVSVYQYLEMRYNSKTVRWIGVLIGMLSTVVYMGLALLSPALAIRGVTDIPIWMSVVGVALIGTVYTTVGGMKSVLWTDVFQTGIIFAGLIAIIIKGTMEIGGVQNLYSISQKGDRLVLNEISPDPRVRHTVWGFLLGYTVYWLSVNLNQSSIQRISSTKSMRHAKLSFLAALPINIFYSLCQTAAGLCMYAFFQHTGCDPLRAGHVTNSNQVIIYYVVNVLGFLPGVPGLYLATILSGSLSTLSSGLNSLAANTVEDFLRHPLSKVSPACLTIVTKLAALGFGCAVTAVAYALRSLQGPVTQLTTTALGATGGPIAGLFILGFVFPQANKVGAITGCMLGLVVNMWISIGGFLYGACKPKKPPGPLFGCPDYSIGSGISQNTTDSGMSLADISSSYSNISLTVNATGPCDGTSGFYLYNISYIWYTLIGCFICVVVGLAVSLIANRFIPHRHPPPQLLLPLARRAKVVTCTDLCPAQKPTGKEIGARVQKMML